MARVPHGSGWGRRSKASVTSHHRHTNEPYAVAKIAGIRMAQAYRRDPEIINIGTGEGVTIRDLALLIRDIVGYRGAIVFDSSKPDGTPWKLLDVHRLTSLG